MNRLDDQVARREVTYVPPRRVNFGWISESWKLFRNQADVWISVAAVSLFAPAILNAFVIYAYTTSRAFAGQAWDNRLQTLQHSPPGLLIGLTILNAIWMVFVTCGIHTLALRQVAGNSVSFSDFASGGAAFGRMLVFLVIYTVVVSIGLTLVVLPGVYAAAMLLPAFALIADGESVGKAISRSYRGMLADRAAAMSLTFLLMVILAASQILVLALFVTAPMAWIISSLAMRDMIGLRSRLSVVDIDFVPPDRRGQVLAPDEEIDPSIIEAAYEYGGVKRSANGEDASGNERVTLSGEAVDDHDAASPSAS
jgi:hypothetical protein